MLMVARQVGLFSVFIVHVPYFATVAVDFKPVSSLVEVKHF